MHDRLARSRKTLWAGAILLAAFACTKDPLTGPNFNCLGSDPVTALTISPRLDTVRFWPAPSPPINLQLKAAAVDTAGAQEPNIPLSYESSNTAVATVNSTGLVQIVGGGSATITVHACDDHASSQIVALATRFSQITVGMDFACATSAGSASTCWGVNDVGQLGAKSDSSCYGDAARPETPPPPCSLSPQSIGPPTIFASITAGDSVACGLAGNGAAYCWGDSAYGELGNGLTSTGYPPSLVTGAITFRSLTAGGYHVCGLASNSLAYCWGRDLEGELGDARQVNSSTPIPVVGGPNPGGPATFASLTAGYLHTCGLATNGIAYCWGANEHGQLGVGDTLARDAPVAVSGGLTFKSLSAGGHHTCGVATSGTAYCWGDADSGQVGIGTVSDSVVLAPTPVVGGGTYVQIVTGRNFTCALAAAGSVDCWGSNTDLEIGIGPYSGSAPPQMTPTRVRNAPGKTVTPAFASIAAGEREVCAVAVASAGSPGAYCWGSNVFGALGNTLQAAYRGYPQPVGVPLN